MKHTCHLPGCNSGCPAAHLLCGPHWRMVPKDLQQEVNATVNQRGKRVDASWAPWWRAQAQAIVAVLRKVSGNEDAIGRYEAREMDFAQTLEAK